MTTQTRSARTLLTVVVATILLALGCTPGEQTAGPATPAVTQPPPEPTPDIASEVRGTWIHLFDDTLKTPDAIDEMLDQVSAAGVNTVIAEVVRRHDAYYESEVLPRTPDPALPEGFDALEHLIEGTRERDLALHAWFPAAPTYHHVYNDLPRPAGWIWADHGPRAPEAQRWVTRHHDGTWSDYLDPGLPEVRAHIAAIAAELAQRQVDAVHIDYPRYPGPDYGYHPRALARFHEQTGRADRPGPRDPQWSDWRREQTHLLMREVRQAVRDVDAGMPLSLAAYSLGEGPADGRPFSDTRPYWEVFQDWPSWIEEGLVDAVFPMAYFDDARNPAWFRQWVPYFAELAERHSVVMAVGIGAWLNTADASVAQAALAQEHTGGVVVYSYQQSASTRPFDQLFGRLASGLWGEPAPPPRLR